MGEWPGILQVSSHNFVTIFEQLGAFINKNPEKIAFNFFFKNAYYCLKGLLAQRRVA
jgi:hypothetical protein